MEQTLAECRCRLPTGVEYPFIRVGRRCISEALGLAIALIREEFANPLLVQEWVMSDRRTSKPRAEPAKSDRHEPLPSNSQARMVARTGLTIALVVLALWITADFLPALGWAAIIAITAWPLYVRCIPYLGESRRYWLH